MKTLDRLDIAREDDVIRFDLHADAFLQHMVRNIVGALVYVGSGTPIAGLDAELLASRDRTRGAPTFAADGLYLTGDRLSGALESAPDAAPVRVPRS